MLTRTEKLIIADKEDKSLEQTTLMRMVDLYTDDCSMWNNNKDWIICFIAELYEAKLFLFSEPSLSNQFELYELGDFFLIEWHFNTVAVVGCNTSLKFACIDSVFAAFLNPHYMVLVFRRGWSIWTKFISFCWEEWILWYSREITKYKLEILVSGVLPVNKYSRKQTRINTRENTARCGRVNGGNGSSSGWLWDVRIYHVTEG